VSQVTELILGQRPGTVVLCAAPTGVDCRDLIGEIAREADRRYSARVGGTFPGIRVIGTPSIMRRRKASEQALLGTYHHSEPVSEEDDDAFQLEMGYGHTGYQTFYTVSSLIKVNPVAAYVVTNVDQLKGHQGMHGVVEGLSMYHDVAERTRRTHVLMGSTTEVLNWLLDPDIASRVVPVVLPPYDIDLKGEDGKQQRSEFAAVIAGYDQVVPWAGDENLQTHFDEIARTVSGSPWRLRKWINSALVRARAVNEARLSWGTFVESQPSAAERMQAWLELCAVRRFFNWGSAEEAVPADRQRAKSPPGIRKPVRDPVAA
jgi:hypothetical protein